MKNRVWIYLIAIVALFTTLTSSCKKDKESSKTPVVDYTGQHGTVTDIDGIVYNTIGIGTQIWMAENLKVTHYRNGDSIPHVTSGTVWGNITIGAYCIYQNTQSISAIYGKLYNWYAANDSRNIAPIGWHIPTDAEWTTLSDYLGGESIAGGKLKEAGTTHWENPNNGATNESGFFAYPGGHRYGYGSFAYIGSIGLWWSSTETDSERGWYRYLRYDNSNFGRSYDFPKNFGCSVRCVKD